MFSFSSAVCRRLMNQRSLRLINSSATFQSKYQPLEKTVLELQNDLKSSKDPTRLGIGYTTKYIHELENDKDIEWDDLLKKLEGMKVQNPSTKILQACIRLNKWELGVDYYNYVISKGQNFTSLDLLFFSKLLISRKSEIKKYEELLINLYYNIKDYMATSSLIRKFILEVFVEIPTCFNDIISNKMSYNSKEGNMALLLKALELNMGDIAFQYMTDSDFLANTEVLNSYINFCVRLAESGKFSHRYIEKLIAVCHEKALPLSHDNLLIPLQSLVNALNKHQSDYYWSVSKCKICENSICSSCKLTLLPKPITKHEFQTLKEHFFQQAFINKNIFMRSTRIELERFLKFLKHTKPYDVVFDGLNLLYRDRQAGTQVGSRYAKYFLDKGCTILIIGRSHSKAELIRKNSLFLQKYKKNVIFFFTSDISDDDVFLLYAALHGGPKTCFVTGDHLGSYAALLNEETRCVFHKWQISHQHVITPQYNVNLALPHCGLPQLTLKSHEKYVWHLPYLEISKSKVSVGIPINWVCLTAEQKSA